MRDKARKKKQAIIRMQALFRVLLAFKIAQRKRIEVREINTNGKTKFFDRKKGEKKQNASVVRKKRDLREKWPRKRLENRQRNSIKYKNTKCLL